MSALPPGFLQERFASAQRSERVCGSVTHVHYFSSFQWCVKHSGVCVCVCSVCDCDEERSVSPHCSDDGACECKRGASGRRCDACLPGYTWRGNGSGCTGELLLRFCDYGSGFIYENAFKLSPAVFSEKVCDEERLTCQNGGTCVNFQRCRCPDNFTGAQHTPRWAGPGG